MNKDEFDRLFDEAYNKMTNEQLDEYSFDYRPSWENVKKQIKAREKKRTIKRTFRNASVIAASMLLGAIIFGSVPITTAFNPIYQSMKKLPGEFITLFFGNQDITDSEAKTKPPKEQQSQDLNVGKTMIISATFEEAKEKLDFELPDISYIPADYKLKKTELFLIQGEETSKKARLTFSNNNNTFWVTLTELSDDTTVGSGANGAKVEEVQLNYGKGFLTISDDGSSKLEFLKGNVYIIILGQLQKEDLIRFAENM